MSVLLKPLNGDALRQRIQQILTNDIIESAEQKDSQQLTSVQVQQQIAQRWIEIITQLNHPWQ